MHVIYIANITAWLLCNDQTAIIIREYGDLHLNASMACLLPSIPTTTVRCLSAMLLKREFSTDSHLVCAVIFTCTAQCVPLFCLSSIYMHVKSIKSFILREKKPRRVSFSVKVNKGFKCWGFFCIQGRRPEKRVDMVER